MNTFLRKNYPALIKGGVITSILVISWSVSGFIINEHSVLFINLVVFVFCWLVISLIIYKFSAAFKILGLLSIFNAAMVATVHLGTSFNLVSVPLITIFWLGIAYLVLPQFFTKYIVAILSVYALVLFYFFFFVMAPNAAEYHFQNFMNFLTVPIPVFAALWGYEQWRWLKTLQADKAKAELSLLKSQINPHFFFNTLNNLYGLVVEKSEEAPDVVLKLSDMMRYTIYEGKKDVVLLKDEISYLENYIELHKIRYQKKVEILFTHDVDEDLKVAPLLFIILLENAFKHGVEKMHEDAFIHLDMYTKEKKLIFEIENNFDEPTKEQNKGIGLGNLKKRLDYIYLNQHELTIEKNESIYKVQLTLNLI